MASQTILPRLKWYDKLRLKSSKPEDWGTIGIPNFGWKTSLRGNSLKCQKPLWEATFRLSHLSGAGCVLVRQWEQLHQPDGPHHQVLRRTEVIIRCHPERSRGIFPQRVTACSEGDSSNREKCSRPEWQKAKLTDREHCLLSGNRRQALFMPSFGVSEHPYSQEKDDEEENDAWSDAAP